MAETANIQLRIRQPKVHVYPDHENHTERVMLEFSSKLHMEDWIAQEAKARMDMSNMIDRTKLQAAFAEVAKAIGLKL